MFPFQLEGKYAIAYRHGGGCNFEFIERDKMTKVITGKLFAAANQPLVHIAESDIVSVVVIPDVELERILKVSAEQQKQWEDQVSRMGADSSVGHYS